MEPSPLETNSDPSGAKASVPIVCESSSEAMQSSTGVPAIDLPVMQEAVAVARPSFSLPMFARVELVPSSTVSVPAFAVR